MKRSSVSYSSFSLYTVYFRLFDVDGNKKVDEADLGGIMKLLFGNRMTPEDVKML